MFKFVVVCALLGAAVAEPSSLLTSYPYPGAVVTSLPQYVPSAYSSIAYSSPLVQPAAVAYSAPVAHFIKKRSASLLVAPPAITTYSAPFATTYPSYSAISPLATSYAAAISPSYSSPVFTTDHLIKKRSVSFNPSYPYVAVSPVATSYATSAPLYTPTISAAPYISSPLINLPYGPFIKK